MGNDKFIWKNNDLKRIDESELRVRYEETNQSFDILKKIGITDYDDRDIEDSEFIAQKIFIKMKEIGIDKKCIYDVFNNFYNLCHENLPKNTDFTKELYYCTKLQIVNMLQDLGFYAFSEQEINDIFS